MFTLLFEASSFSVSCCFMYRLSILSAFPILLRFPFIFWYLPHHDCWIFLISYTSCIYWHSAICIANFILFFADPHQCFKTAIVVCCSGTEIPTSQISCGRQICRISSDVCCCPGFQPTEPQLTQHSWKLKLLCAFIFSLSILLHTYYIKRFLLVFI